MIFTKRLITVFIGGVGYIAKLDTGAFTSSIDESLVRNLDPIKTKKIRTSTSLVQQERPVVEVETQIGEEIFVIPYTVADRSPMKYKIILGYSFLLGHVIDLRSSDYE